MITAFVLALTQLTDRRILAVLLKSAGLTLFAVGLLGWGLWAGSTSLLDGLGLDTMLADGGTIRGFIAAVTSLLGVWLLFRLVALAVLQLFADEVVEAVEVRHYPEIAARARPLGLHRELGLALRGALRSLVWNLAALPFALVLVVTGVGPFMVFAAVNAMLLGRELTDTVRMRHRDERGLPLPDLHFVTRFALGSICVGLLTVPFINLLASVMGASMATHLVHRRPAV
jgi:uncharacterized protein involved in cysteine biosynthesis